MERANEMVASAPPPYTAFENFDLLVRKLAKTGVPPSLRAYELPVSQHVRAQLLPALRFLGLIDDRLQPTVELHGLATDYGSQGYADRLASVLRSRYPELAAIDLATDAPGTLMKALGGRGLSPDVARKALRFYLSAAEHAGWEIGPRLRFGRRTSPAPRQ